MVIAPLLVPSSGPALATAAGGMFFVVGIGAFSAVGALLIARVPGNLIGTLLLTVGTFMVAAILIGDYGAYGSLQDPPWPGSNGSEDHRRGAADLRDLRRPDRDPAVLPGRSAAVAALSVDRSAHGRAHGRLGARVGPRRVAGRWRRGSAPRPHRPRAVMDALEMFVFVATFLSFGSALVAVWLRFRRGDLVERQQVKWLVAVVAFGAVVWPVSLPPARTRTSPTR